MPVNVTLTVDASELDNRSQQLGYDSRNRLCSQLVQALIDEKITLSLEGSVQIPSTAQCSYTQLLAFCLFLLSKLEQPRSFTYIKTLKLQGIETSLDDLSANEQRLIYFSRLLGFRPDDQDLEMFLDDLARK